MDNDYYRHILDNSIIILVTDCIVLLMPTNKVKYHFDITEICLIFV